jgi:hypothetical protein
MCYDYCNNVQSVRQGAEAKLLTLIPSVRAALIREYSLAIYEDRPASAAVVSRKPDFHACARGEPLNSGNFRQFAFLFISMGRVWMLMLG